MKKKNSVYRANSDDVFMRLWHGLQHIYYCEEIFLKKSHAEQMLTSQKWCCIKTLFIITNEVYKLDLKNIQKNFMYFLPAIQKTYDGLLTHFLCKLLI